MQALAVHATQDLGDPHTMALVVQHTLGLEGRVIAGQAVLGTMVLVVQHTMALVGRVMRGLVDPVTRGQGERRNHVPRYVSEVTS